MSAKHTPGPWHADEWAPGWTVSAPSSHYSVCHLKGCNNEEANARLIAAAPELLAALEEIGEYKGEGGPGTPWREIVRDVGAKARAAVAKATGTQP